VVAVIGASIILACAGWIAASDVLALNKEEKEVTLTISNGESFGSVADRLKEEGLIEYKWLFKLFASFTGSKDKVTMGTYTLNTDMDYRALLAGMSANSANRSVVKVTIPEGYTVDMIFRLLEEKGVATVEELQEAAADHDYAFSFLKDIPLGDYHRLDDPNAETVGYLQVDATLVYINGGKEPTEADKSIDSPYNTYLYKGLPPGPIANPGMEAIAAALSPDSTKDLFYALGDDGKHHFFRTYAELQSFTASQELYG